METFQTNNHRKVPGCPGLRDKWERWSWRQDCPVGVGTYPGRLEHGGGTELMLIVEMG